MRKVLTKLEIPDKVEIKGVCQPMDGRITTKLWAWLFTCP